MIDSPALARDIADAFDRDIPARAYRVRLGASGALQWVEAGGECVHDREPGTGFWLRLGVRLLALLPIEWLL